VKRAFILSTGADTGGAAVRVVEAFRGSRSWSVRSMVASTNYIAYPADLPYERAELDIRYRDADVVVLNNTLHGHHWYDEGQGKPTVLMHHGLHDGHYAQSLGEVIEEATDIGAIQIGSTVNLELFGPITWVPIPYDLDALAAMRKRLYRPKPGVVRVAHCPTDRTIKSTDAFLSAVEDLQARDVPIEAVLVEGKTHEETLAIKATSADVLVDQVMLGYGNNAIEAWGMGIPVLGGVSQYPDWREHMLRRFRRLPFFEVDEASLGAGLEQMAVSERLRAEWGAIGLDHVRRFHSRAVVVEQLAAVYAQARPSKPSDPALTRRKPRNYVAQRCRAHAAARREVAAWRP